MARKPLVAPPVLVEDARMSRFPGAEIGADELPDEVHLLADRIESITGKDVYFLDARTHRFGPGQTVAGAPPPAISGPPAGEDIVVFVNPDALDRQQLSNGVRRFLIQALLVWEGYPMAALKPAAPDAATSGAGLLQQWLHMGLLSVAAEGRAAELTGVAPDPRQMSRLPPFNMPPEVRSKMVDFESAMTNVDSEAPSPGARTITDIMRGGDLKSPGGFRQVFGRILDLWNIRQHVILGVANKETGAIGEVAW
jgi:hypothetical protein